MIDGLKRLNVYKNKHIPRIYLESSIEQRLELLAGIIDTDGNCEKDGRIRIITAREELKDGIVELATSLGFYPSCIRRDTQSGFKGTGSWCIYFKVDFPLPVALERKQPKVFSNRTNVYIKSAQSIETSEFGRCIQVDSADGLYLAGRKLIPTHNSEIASKTFPAWYLGHHPEHDIIACSYSSALAIDFSRKVRGLVQDERYQNIFDTRMDESSQSAERWNTSAGGGYVAAGVQGPITGRGAHVGIIDDPLKDRDSAESETIRQSIKDWYSSTFYTRLAPGAGVILIMTRWHDSDLGGWLLQCMKEAEQEAAETGEWPEDADKWEVVRYPAIATHDEPYRKAGEALHPARYDLKALMKIKRTLIPRDWEALYQQNPTSADGDYFKKEYFRMYDSAPPLDTLRVYAAWDLAIGKKESNDYTCGIVVGVDRSNDIWVLHRYYGRFDAKELIEKFFECQETWKPTLQGIEHGQIEMTLEPFILKEMTESGRSLNYIKLKTRGNDKMTRARPIQGRMQQMRVHFPSGASWFQELQNEMLAFPSGKHDDQVDAMAWVGQMILMMSPNREKAPPPKKSWRDSLRKQIHSTQGYGLSHMAS
ncbi:phage terminase large subunit [Gallibacterium anatis]|uniref:phage terminase large subunit n=1 Tax=Gallibacterium anatis TaxID=750 RepID=UPI0039FD910A